MQSRAGKVVLGGDDGKLMHDLRNQLNSITMQTEVAKMLVETQGDSKKVIASLERSLEACQVCAQLLNKNFGNA